MPANIGELAHLTALRIADNTDLAGRLPVSLSRLPLQTLHYSGTALCVPSHTSFRVWLGTIPSHDGTGVECPPISVFTELLQQFTDAHGIGAAALGIMKQGEIIYDEGVGYMDAQRQVPARQDIMMRLASVTKPITAAAIHRLASDGMLALNDRVFDLGQTGGGLLQIDPFPQQGDARLAKAVLSPTTGATGSPGMTVYGDAETSSTRPGLRFGARKEGGITRPKSPMAVWSRPLGRYWRLSRPTRSLATTSVGVAEGERDPGGGTTREASTVPTRWRSSAATGRGSR